MNAARPELTGIQRDRIELARKVAAASAEELAEGTLIGPGDWVMLYSHALGHMRGTVGDLLKLVEELTGGAS